MSKREHIAAYLTKRIKSRKAQAGIIGLGYIGTTIMHGFINEGFPVVGYDRCQSAVETCRSRTMDSFGKKEWKLDKDPVVLSDAEVLVVTVRTIVQPGYDPDLEPLRSVAQMLSKMNLNGRIILVESTLPPGSTRLFAQDWLGLDETAPTFVAHSPERLSTGEDWRELRSLPHLVGGLDPLATKLATKAIGAIVDNIVPVSAPEVSELSKLLENAFMTVGISLVAEITRAAQRFSVTGTEVCAAAATKPSGYLPFFPGPGIGGYCLPNDLSILRHTFRTLEEDAPILDAAAEELVAMPGLVIRRLADLLAGKIEGANVLLVGIGFKPGASETSGTPAYQVVQLLRNAGAKPVYVDGNVDVFEVDGQPVEKMDISELGPGHYQAALILSGDQEVDPKVIAVTADQVIDASGGRAPGADRIVCTRL
jgi:UDP-N-acetyl-D-glucosamine dehydrogenase